MMKQEADFDSEKQIYLKQTWLDAFFIREEMLSETEKLEVSFIFSGLVAVLGSKEVKDSPLKMYELAQSELGKTIIAELGSMKKSCILHSFSPG